MFAYAGVLVVANVEYAWLVPVILFAVMFARRTQHALTAYGTARWADASDMQGMLDE
jgi:hypothetical protein